MGNCRECVNFKVTYGNNGYCSEWDMYTTSSNGCGGGYKRNYDPEEQNIFKGNN